MSDVRDFTRKTIGTDEGTDAVELVASELAGNAIRHSLSGLPKGQFTVHLAVLANRWIVRVDDAGGCGDPRVCTTPILEKPEDLDDCDDDVETGRGLALVAALSSQWGVLGDGDARSVWAEIPIPERTRGELF